VLYKSVIPYILQNIAKVYLHSNILYQDLVQFMNILCLISFKM